MNIKQTNFYGFAFEEMLQPKTICHFVILRQRNYFIRMFNCSSQLDKMLPFTYCVNMTDDGIDLMTYKHKIQRKKCHDYYREFDLKPYLFGCSLIEFPAK